MPFDDKELLKLQPNLLRFCQTRVRPEDAEDLCQDTMTNALAKKHLFHGGELMGWLIHMAKNISTSDSRRSWRPLNADQDRIEYLTHERIGDTQPEALSRIELQQTVLALAFLTAGKRDALLATWDTDMDYTEIAKNLGIPSGTVKSRVFNARKDLGNIMDTGTIQGIDSDQLAALKTSLSQINQTEENHESLQLAVHLLESSGMKPKLHNSAFITPPQLG